MQTGETKIDVNYDEIKSIDNTLGYYLVKSNSKYGIINSKQESIIHIEYDKIGIDVSDFPADSIKNPYILYDTLIPVCSNQKWGLFNVNGNKMTEIEYDSIGSINTKVKERVVNNAAVIGESGVVVLGKDGKYGGISTRGDMLLPIQFEYIYSVTSGGETNYYIVINEKDYKALDYINAMKKALGYPIEEDENENTDNKDNQTITSTPNQDTNNTVENENSLTNTAQNILDGANRVMENATEPMNNAAVNAFNTKFSAYEGEEVKGSTVKTLIMAVTNSNSLSDEKVKVEFQDRIYENDEINSIIDNIVSTSNYKVSMEKNNQTDYIEKISIK